MPSLRNADDRFGALLTIIDGGSGQFTGIVSEPGQGEVPAYAFNLPRRLLRVEAGLPLRAGQVVRSPEGTVWMLGQHGAAETNNGTLFRNFRLFEATGQFRWERRGKAVDPTTRLPKDTGLQLAGMIWGVYEPGSSELFDRTVHSSFETGRFITTAPVELNDMIDGKKVSRVDLQLGVNVVTLG